MVKKIGLVMMLLALGCLAWAQDKDKDDNSSAGMSELQAATNAVQQMTSSSAEAGVPHDVVENARCVAVIPKLTKGAFVVGGEHGDGVATCRTSSGWSAPAPFSVSGISFGPQIGGKQTDLLMFVMNDQGMNQLMSGHFKVGGDVSAAAGPVGRSASAEGGYKAAILTYSASKGAFIGASLNGAEINQDTKATKAWYGRDIAFKDILAGQAQVPNAQARAFVNAVQNAKESAANR